MWLARAAPARASSILPRYAASEDELYYLADLRDEEALRVTVATTPAFGQPAGRKSLSGVTVGNMLFQTTAELPEMAGQFGWPSA